MMITTSQEEVIHHHHESKEDTSTAQANYAHRAVVVSFMPIYVYYSTIHQVSSPAPTQTQFSNATKEREDHTHTHTSPIFKKEPNVGFSYEATREATR